MSEVTGARFRPLWAGSLGLLGGMIRIAKLAEAGAGEALPPWQGMQCMRDRSSGSAKLAALDNCRYRDLA